MVTFQHVTVLVSIIIGLGIAHLLTGVVRLIQTPRRRKPYWLHLLWVLTTFLTLVTFWWFQLGLAAIEEISFLNYLYVVVYAVLLFAMCVILFPLHDDDVIDFRAYYHGPGKWFFAIIIALLLVDLGDSALKGVDRLAALGAQYFIGQAVMAALALASLATRRTPIHAGFAVIWLSYMVYGAAVAFWVAPPD